MAFDLGCTNDQTRLSSKSDGRSRNYIRQGDASSRGEPAGRDKKGEAGGARRKGGIRRQRRLTNTRIWEPLRDLVRRNPPRFDGRKEPNNIQLDATIGCW